jgi:deazaflavin-dependent oxidoreductase (nitroreductase family)
MQLTDIERDAVDATRPWAQKHIRQYLAGEDVEHPSADRLILLYTTGRVTGKIRRTPVVQFPDGDDMLVVASQGGAPENPQWYFNLEADPRAWVRYYDDFFEARAEILDPEERAPVWERITAHTPAFAEYQAKVERVIPVVRLVRADR